MLKQIKQLEGIVKEMIPSHFGIIVRPYSSTTTTATQVKHKYHRYRVLNSLKSSSYSSHPVARKLGRPKTKRQRTRVKYILDVRFYNLLLYMNYYHITYSLSYLFSHDLICRRPDKKAVYKCMLFILINQQHLTTSMQL